MFTFFWLQSGFSNFPCVFKVGHAHAGMGKVKVESEKGFQVNKLFMHQRARIQRPPRLWTNRLIIYRLRSFCVEVSFFSPSIMCLTFLIFQKLFVEFSFSTGKLRKNLFGTNKKFVYLNIITNFRPKISSRRHEKV